MRSLAKVPRRRASESPAAVLPALPLDVWACIMRLSLAVEGSTAQARGRLSLVCRAWRDALRGAIP